MAPDPEEPESRLLLEQHDACALHRDQQAGLVGISGRVEQRYEHGRHSARPVRVGQTAQAGEEAQPVRERAPAIACSSAPPNLDRCRHRPHPPHAVGDGHGRRGGGRRRCRRRSTSGSSCSRRRRRPRTPTPSSCSPGGEGERLDRGLELVQRRGGVEPRRVDRARPACAATEHDFAVFCFVPDPDDTRGEAEAVGRLAAREGWHHLVLVTSDYHATRARILARALLPRHRRRVRGPQRQEPAPAAVGRRPRVGRPDRGRHPPRLLISPPASADNTGTAWPPGVPDAPRRGSRRHRRLRRRAAAVPRAPRTRRGAGRRRSSA